MIRSDAAELPQPLRCPIDEPVTPRSPPPPDGEVLFLIQSLNIFALLGWTIKSGLSSRLLISPGDDDTDRVESVSGPGRNGNQLPRRWFRTAMPGRKD